MVLHLLCQYSLLYLTSVFEKLLYDIVSENVGHQLESVWLNLTENLLLLIAVGSFELLLNEAGSMLITAEFYDMMVDILCYGQTIIYGFVGLWI